MSEFKAFIAAHIVDIPADDLVLNPIDGDAGFRHYYRIEGQPGFLAVHAPVATEDSRQFCNVAGWLRKHGVRAPEVYAVDFEQGFLLVEDLGAVQLQLQLNDSSVAGYYAEASSMLLHMQSSPIDNGVFPVYNAELLLAELTLFKDWYVTQYLKLSLTQRESECIDEVFKLLIERAQAEAQVVVHRDFHSRNLLVLHDGSLACIDFQDAVIGPLTYDLVSLLKDCYVKWDASLVEQWALSYGAMAHSAGLLEAKSEAEFLGDFHWMGLQRHLKVLGIFARLSLRDGKHGYLNDLPRVLEYVCEVTQAYPEFSAFNTLLHTRIRPAVAKLGALL